MNRLLFLLHLIIAGLLLSACKDEVNPAPASTEARASADTWLPLTVGDKKIDAQLAITTQEKRLGLMHRESMKPDNGMLFIFTEPDQMSFWMKNTRIPLDIAYITPDGVIREIYQMQPFDTSSIVSHRHDIQLALEMNQDWFAKNSIDAGDKLNMDELRTAIRQRGYNPASLGIE